MVTIQRTLTEHFCSQTEIQYTIAQSAEIVIIIIIIIIILNTLECKKIRALI